MSQWSPGMPAGEAVAALAAAHGGRLYHLARRFCGNEHEAEDLVQETFLRALRGWDGFRGRSDPATWLYTIAARACRRMHRRRSGQPRRVLSLSRPIRPDGPVPDLPDTGQTPLSKQIEAEARRAMEEAIAGLPEPFRMALILKDVAGLDLAQTAAVMGLRPATVKTRVHRARLAVRDAVARRLPARQAPPPAYNRRVCLDLLSAKQSALDRGVEFPMTPDFCERCRAVFASLDLTTDWCARWGDQPPPRPVAHRLKALLDREIAESTK